MTNKGGHGAPERKLWRIEETPSHFKTRYRRFALVSHPRHLGPIEEDDDDTLIVSCDWLLWQEGLNDGRHILYFEAGLIGWDGDGYVGELLTRPNEWAYLDGVNATIFDGVSLAHQFVREMHLFTYCSKRLEAALENLIGRFGPEEIIYMDYRAEIPFLDAATRLDLVSEAANRHGISLRRMDDPADPSDPLLPIGPKALRVEESFLTAPQSPAMKIYGRLMETMSLLRRGLGAKRRRVLMAMTHLNVIPLLEGLDDRAMSPVVLARRFPRKKDPGFVFKCLSKAVVWAAGRDVRLNDAETRRLDDIGRTLKEAWDRDPGEGYVAVMRRYVRKNIIDAGRLVPVARELVCLRDILDRHKPDRIIIDGLENPTVTMLAALATGRGIGVDHTWHGQYLHNDRTYVLGSEDGHPPIVERALTWGPMHERWLDNIDAKVEIRRTGNPATTQRGESPGNPSLSHDVKHGVKKALLLQYTPNIEDIQGLNERQFRFFVEIARFASNMGAEDIRMKMHPGLIRSSYYRRIADYFGLDAQVHGHGVYKEFAAWADYVIGPGISGAMPETLSLAKPYYPLALTPHGCDPDLLSMVGAIETLEALKEALGARTPPDPERSMGALYDAGTNESPVSAVWRALSAK